MTPFTFSKNTEEEQTNLSSRKAMATVFRDRKDILLVTYMSRGVTINAEAYITPTSPYDPKQKTRMADQRCYPHPRQRGS